MMWLMSIIQFWFKITFKNKNTSDHEQMSQMSQTNVSIDKIIKKFHIG